MPSGTDCETDKASSAATRSNAGEPPAQSWSYAFFALLTTAAILGVALAAPAVFNELALQFDVFTDPGNGSGDTASVRSAVTWGHLLSFQFAVVTLTALMASVPRNAGASLGWQPSAGHLSWLQPLLVTIAVSASMTAIAFIFFPEIVARDLEPIRRLVLSAPVWLSFSALAIGAPLSEELLFRGYLLHRLKQTPLGFWGAALISNIGWTLLHINYSWLGLADVFLAGLLFSWALWKTGSIWVPIAFHAFYNATVLFILLFLPSESPVPGISPMPW